MHRFIKALILGVGLLAVSTPASAQLQYSPLPWYGESHMRAGLDDCYPGEGEIQCVGWTVANGYSAYANFAIATYQDGIWWEHNMNGTPDNEYRADVCPIVESWSWSCNEGGDYWLGKRQVLDTTALAPGWHYVRLYSWHPPVAPLKYTWLELEGSPLIYWFYVS